MPPLSAALTVRHETKRLTMSAPLSPQHNEQPSNRASLAALIERLHRFFLDQHIESYLVGGGLRDLLRGQPPQDLDLAIQGEAIPTARKLADTLGGFFALLRQEKDVARVILPASAHISLVIDVAALRNGKILDDLAQRDFTINALALPLEDIPSPLESLALSAWSAQSVLIDPFHGLHDLQQQTLRAVQDHIFYDDPLRLLRAIRIAHRLQFRLARSTSALLQRDASLLIKAAPERIRDELLQIINLPGIEAAIQALDDYHLLPALFPSLNASGNLAVIAKAPGSKEARWKTLSFLSHLLRVFKGASVPLTAQEQFFFSRFAQISEAPSFRQRWQNAQNNAFSRATLLTLASLVYDLPLPPQQANTSDQHQLESLLQPIKSDLQRLALGRQATDFILFLLRHARIPWQIAHLPESGSVRQWSAGRHYFQHYGEQGIDLAVFCLACRLARIESLSPDKTAQDHIQILVDLLNAYYHAHDELIPSALIDGQDIIAALEITSGPLVGVLLAEVRNAQLDGALQTREEAFTFVKDRAAQMTTIEKQKQRQGRGAESTEENPQAL